MHVQLFKLTLPPALQVIVNMLIGLMSNALDKVGRPKRLWCGCAVLWCFCGVVWCGVFVVWCGVVWCGVVWCGVVWCGVVYCAGCAG